jgi:hypothetical protein
MAAPIRGRNSVMIYISETRPDELGILPCFKSVNKVSAHAIRTLSFPSASESTISGTKHLQLSQWHLRFVVR